MGHICYVLCVSKVIMTFDKHWGRDKHDNEARDVFKSDFFGGKDW